jgi:ABC-type transporter Mla MlaB component
MLRISEANGSGPAMLRLEGRLADRWVDEFARVVSAAEPGLVSIDLSDVSFVDARGVELLQQLGRRGVGLVGGSPFVVGLVSGGSR